MGQCDQCRRGLIQAAISGATALLVPGCGGGRGPSALDGADPAEGGDGAPGDDAAAVEGGGATACEPACPAGTRTIELPFSKYPQLRNAGGSALHTAPGYSDPFCHLDTIIVAQPSAGTYVAFSAGCPHQCCIVSFNATHTELVCPCHGSTFDMRGQVRSGPAPNGLQVLSACADDCGVYVTLP